MSEIDAMIAGYGSGDETYGEAVEDRANVTIFGLILTGFFLTMSGVAISNRLPDIMLGNLSNLGPIWQMLGLAALSDLATLVGRGLTRLEVEDAEDNL